MHLESQLNLKESDFSYSFRAAELPPETAGRQLRVAGNRITVRDGRFFFGEERPLSRENAVTKFRGFEEAVADLGDHEAPLMEQQLSEKLLLPPYDHSPSLLTMPEVLYKVGMEIEGAWRSEPSRRVVPDGSVHCGPRCDYSGEIHTLHTSTRIQWDSIEADWPDYVDSSCGLHVHLSFPNVAVYSVFVAQEFQPWLLKGLRKFGRHKAIDHQELYKRLAGKNSFCVNDYRAETQLYLDHKGSGRYTAINYCWGLHGTLEVRVLPGFAIMEQAKLMISEMLRLFHVWADFNAKQPLLGRSLWGPRFELEPNEVELVTETEED